MQAVNEQDSNTDARQPKRATVGRGGGDDATFWDFFNPFFLLAYLLCFVPAFVFAILRECTAHGIGLVREKNTPQVVREPAGSKKEESATTTPPHSAFKNGSKRPTPDASWDSPDIEVSEIGRVELDDKGYVVFLFHKSKSVAKGRFTSTAKTLQRAGIRTVAIEVPCQTFAEALARMKEKAEDIIASAKERRKRVRTSNKAQESEKSPASGESKDDNDIPAYMAAEDEAMFCGQEMSQESSCPMPEFDDEPIVQTATAPSRSAAPVAKPSVCYRGTLQSFGMEPRKLVDPKNGDHVVNHYCVRIFDETLRAEQPLWGNDLQRVIEEASAVVGNRVELGLIGETSVLVKGKPRKKKIWSLTRL
jgi:hypothetical protein